MKFITIQRNTICGQSKWCFLCIQIRYTRFLFKRFWKSDPQKQGLHVYIFAPIHDPKTGYHCRRLAIR